MALQSAKAPERFTVKFLESLDFKSNYDRLVINVLKSLRFLDDQGRPLDRYFSFLDQTQAAYVMADAVEETYSDLFQVNTRAYTMTKPEVCNKMKTLSQGQYSEAVIDKMAMTFLALVKVSDFEKRPNVLATPDLGEPTTLQSLEAPNVIPEAAAIPKQGRHSLGGLHYNIQIILPDARDPKVYDALFRSLKEHLF